VSARGPRTKSTTPTQARAYLSKSEEYLAAAERELGERLNVGATSLAIHAGISAADAVSGIRLGKRSAGLPVRFELMPNKVSAERGHRLCHSNFVR